MLQEFLEIPRWTEISVFKCQIWWITGSYPKDSSEIILPLNFSDGLEQCTYTVIPWPFNLGLVQLVHLIDFLLVPSIYHGSLFVSYLRIFDSFRKHLGNSMVNQSFQPATTLSSQEALMTTVSSNISTKSHFFHAPFLPFKLWIVLTSIHFSLSQLHITTCKTEKI